MGRRQLFTQTDIKRLISSFKRNDRIREHKTVLSYESGGKDGPTTITLQHIEFDINTRKATIIFNEEHQYRTIERYVTQDYVRYPIYSSWKTKLRKIKQSIKLDNYTLENLNRHSEPLIKEHAFDIISRLDGIDYPSWFMEELFRREYDEEKKRIRTQIAECDQAFERSKKASKEANQDLIKRNIEAKYKAAQKRRDRLFKRVERIRNFNKPLLVLLKIITLGFVKIFVSENRLEKLNTKLLQAETAVRQNKEIILNAHFQEKDLERKKAHLYSEKQKLNEELEAAYRKMTNAIREVKTLFQSTREAVDFISLKSLIGLPYEKIVGCYIIRNKNNLKCYVGQSKDVHKRIKQHFHGTQPANIIFAEDYYTSDPQQRDDLFEVKIIKCETKDALDQTERNLIEEYQAFKTGYNGTAGNK